MTDFKTNNMENKPGQTPEQEMPFNEIVTSQWDYATKEAIEYYPDDVARQVAYREGIFKGYSKAIAPSPVHPTGVEEFNDTQKERNKTDATVYIDRAISMFKEERAFVNVAAYNGIVSLLEYAKDSHAGAKWQSSGEAVEFLEWCATNGCWRNGSEGSKWYSMRLHFDEDKTTEQLYQLFKEHRNENR